MSIRPAFYWVELAGAVVPYGQEELFFDNTNTVHTAHVHAETLYEAVVLVQALRVHVWVLPIGNASKVSVEVRQPVVTHEVQVSDMDVQWTQGTPTSPADMQRRVKLAKLLHESGF